MNLSSQREVLRAYLDRLGKLHAARLAMRRAIGAASSAPLLPPSYFFICATSTGLSR
jgi:hypothetical protein